MISYNPQVFEFVKGTILKCLNNEDKCSKSLWARECYPQTVKAEQLVLEAVEHRFVNQKIDWLPKNFYILFCLN